MIDPAAKSSMWLGLLTYLVLMLVPVALRLWHVHVATWLLWLVPLAFPLCFALLFWLLSALDKLLSRQPERSPANA